MIYINAVLLATTYPLQNVMSYVPGNTGSPLNTNGAGTPWQHHEWTLDSAIQNHIKYTRFVKYTTLEPDRCVQALYISVQLVFKPIKLFSKSSERAAVCIKLSTKSWISLDKIHYHLLQINVLLYWTPKIISNLTRNYNRDLV